MIPAASSRVVSITRQNLPRYYPSAVENSLCAHEGTPCYREIEPGHLFCLQHIKLDRTGGGYRQCNYISSKSGRRCSNITSHQAYGKEGFCLHHARVVARVRRAASRHKQVQKNTDTVLANLRCKYEEYKGNLSTLGQPGSASSSISKLVGSSADYEPDSVDTDEDFNEIPLDRCELGKDEMATEPDISMDPLRNAGVYTVEEIARITRDKMFRLHNLYLEDFRLLEQDLKLTRKEFVRSAKQERLKYGPLDLMEIHSTEENKQVRRLKAMRHYRRSFGVKKWLKKQSMQRRREYYLGAKPIPKPKRLCNFAECTFEALLDTKFCRHHILNDPEQLLFVKCEASGCQLPIVVLDQLKQCPFHSLTPLMQKPKEEELARIVEELKQAEAMTVFPSTSSAEIHIEDVQEMFSTTNVN